MKRKAMVLVIMFFPLMISSSVFAEGYLVTSDLWIKAVINTVEKGPIDAMWQKGGEDTTSRGDRVIWGHFYASPNDVTWGSENNPDLFVKIWFDVSGRVDVNYFHVSVPDIVVYSDYPYDGAPDEQGTTTTDRRYIRQYYENSQSYSDEQTEDGNPPSGYSPTGNPFGFTTINNLRIGALINIVEKGPTDAVWRLGGQDTTTRGDQVVWGHFYASPSDVTWGSQNNPDLFVKIWFDASGRIDVNFFHVSVPDIEVCSDYPRDGTYDQRGTTIMANRYIRGEYWMSTDNQEASISPDSVVLDDETTQGLSSVSSDNSTLTFDSLTSALQTLQQNDVIAIGVTEKTPYGLLRKVTSVTQQGNQVVVQTTQAKLTDVIEQGSISVSKTLTTSDINTSSASVKTLKGVSLRPIPKVKNARAAAAAVGIDPDNELFNLELADVVLYDHDGNENTTYDQIVADGGISFGLSFNLDIQIDWLFKLQYLSFTTTPWQTAEIEISSSISKSIEKKIQIAQFYTSPITVFVGVPPVWPVIMVPVVTLYVGLDGEVSVDITTGVTQSASITAGVEYQDSEWSPISGYSLDFDYQPPVLSASASAKAYVEPEFTLLIYGVTGPYATLQGYLQLNADINDDPWWSLYTGIAVGVGVEVEVIGHEIVDFGIPDIIDYQRLLSEAESPFNTPPTAIVGSWGSGHYTDPNDSEYMSLTFYPNGYYIHYESDDPSSEDDNGGGVEYGKYDYNSQTGKLVVTSLIVNENGDHGLSDFVPGGDCEATVTIDGDTMTYLETCEDGWTETYSYERVKDDSSLIVGSWGPGHNDDPSISDYMSLTFYSNGYYIHWESDKPNEPCDYGGGVEYGTYTYDPITEQLTVNPILDENGCIGPSEDGQTSQWQAEVSADILTIYEDSEVGCTLERVE